MSQRPGMTDAERLLLMSVARHMIKHGFEDLQPLFNQVWEETEDAAKKRLQRDRQLSDLGSGGL